MRTHSRQTNLSVTYLATKCLSALLLVCVPYFSPNIYASEKPQFDSPVIRPSIWVKPSDRESILDKINTEEWAKSLYSELKSRVKPYATTKQSVRKNNLYELPLLWYKDKSISPTLPKFRIKNGGSRDQLRSVVKGLQDGVDCGVMYFLTEQDKYAACAADILHTYIHALKTLKVQRDGPQNSGWMFPADHLYEARVIGAQLPVIYDFVYPYLKSGGKVYDLASKKLVPFDFELAQKTFKTYVWLALNKGLLDSNWPVLESSSLVHNILAIDNAEEIKRLLPYYTHINTKHQASLKMVAENYASEGDIWPESMGYSRHVGAFSIYLMTLLDRYDSNLKLGEKYPNISANFKSYYDLKFPNGDYPYIGDGHRRYKVEYSAIEMSYLLTRLNKNKEQAEYYGNFLASSIEQGVYDRGHLHKRSYGASPYYTPTQLLWFAKEIEATADLDITPPRPRTKRLEFAGMNIQRNTDFSDPVKNSLMAFTAGGSYIHGHASGMDMELYGQGYVLGIDGGKGKYRSDIHENYYRLFAAHNSVISNGASASSGGWINLGINTVKAEAYEPQYGEPGVSPKNSFTTTSFYDEFNLVAPAEHQRTVALIKVSDTAGYYLDIFKAKSDYENQYHDYVYHNLGDSLNITSQGKKVALKDDGERYKASASRPWNVHKDYRHPGWHFFENVQSHGPSKQSYEATFVASKLQAKSISMRALIPAGSEQEITRTMAPRAHGAAKPYNEKPLPTMVLRKQGDAWTDPFVVAYESKTGSEDYSLVSVERIQSEGVFKGVRVQLQVEGEMLTQYIIAQDNDDDVYEDKAKQLYFKGRFAVLTLDRNSELREAYIGSGERVSYKRVVLEADTSSKSAYKVF